MASPITDHKKSIRLTLSPGSTPKAPVAVTSAEISGAMIMNIPAANIQPQYFFDFIIGLYAQTIQR